MAEQIQDAAKIQIKKRGMNDRVKAALANVCKQVVPPPTSMFQRLRDGIQSGIQKVIQPVTQVHTTLPTQSHLMFVRSNTMVAKFVFIVLALLLFVVFCTLGISFISLFFDNQKKSPYLLYGYLDGSNSMVVSQNPKDESSVAILRSDDRSKGIEFTWCAWLQFEGNINSTTAVKYQNIFNKGDTYYDRTTGVATVNNGPGLYLSSLVNNENVLHIIMDTVSPNEGPCIVNVKDIPFKKWFHVCIRVQNKVLDVYINGTIASRQEMKAVPKQNYNDVNLCQNGGFAGKISNLRYHGYALSASDIGSIVYRGPNLNSASYGAQSSSADFSGYFSAAWFTQQQ